MMTNEGAAGRPLFAGEKTETEAKLRALADEVGRTFGDFLRGAISAAIDDASDTFLIWSNEHRQWWGPDERGYVDDTRRAGVYSRARAFEICGAALAGWLQRGRIGPMDEILVRTTDLNGFILASPYRSHFI